MFFTPNSDPTSECRNRNRDSSDQATFFQSSVTVAQGNQLVPMRALVMHASLCQIWLCSHVQSQIETSFPAHLPPVLPEGSGACLERCQYSYDKLRGINDCPSVRIDMSGYSCSLEEVIIWLSLSNDRRKHALVHGALMDDETLESAGKVAKTLGFSFFTAACRFAKWTPDLNKLQRSWILLAVCIFFLPRLFMLPVTDCVLWVLNMME